MKFNDKLRALRKEKEFSQEYLAERMNVSRQTISKWENGTAMPDLKKLTELAELFDTSMDELLGTSAPAPRVDNSGNVNIEEIERYAYAVAKEQIDAFAKKNKTRHTVLSVSIILLTIAIIITNITLLSNVNNLHNEINNMNSNNTHYIYNENDNEFYPSQYVDSKIVEVDKENPNKIKLELTYSPGSYAKGTVVSFIRSDSEKEKSFEAEQKGNSFIAAVPCDLTKAQKISVSIDDGTNISTEIYLDNVVDFYAGIINFDACYTYTNDIYDYTLYPSEITWTWDENDSRPKLVETYLEAIDSSGKVIKEQKINYDFYNLAGNYPKMRVDSLNTEATIRLKFVDELGTEFYYYGSYSDENDLYSKTEISFPNGKEYKLN